MLRRLVILHLCAIGLFAIHAGPSHARCEGAIPLGGVHDAYLAMLTEDGQGQRIAASTLLALLGKDGGGAFAARLKRAGVEVPEDRLSAALSDGRDLASHILSGGTPPPGLSHHSANVAFLGDAYVDTGCRNVTPARQIVRKAPEAEGTTHADRVVSALRKYTDDGHDYSHTLLVALGAICLAGILGFVIHRIFSSIRVRRFRVARQPRTLVSIRMNVTFEGADGPETREVRAMDYSVGGMKLAWESPPQPGTAISVELPTGKKDALIIWANPHYVGIMFDGSLTRAELAALSGNK